MNFNRYLNSLQRITSKGDFTPEIDGLRFLAIFPVVIMHINTNYIRVFGAPDVFINSDFNKFIHFGELGVRFFFAISGFVLCNAFAKFFFNNGKTFKEFNLKSYYLRRLTRLEPPFLLSTIVLYFFSGIFVIGSLTSILPNLIGTLTYTHYLWYGKWSVINPVTWSLEVEIQFYLLAPFIGYLFFSCFNEKVRNIVLIILIIGSPFLFLSADSIFVTNSHLTKSLVVYLSHFGVGILMSSLYTGTYWNKIKSSYLLDITCLLAVAGIFIYYPMRVGYSYIFDLCILIIMICGFKGKIIRSFFANKLISTIGGMCYSIYLIHYGVVFGLMKITKYIKFDNFYINWVFQVILSLLVISVCSALFYKYFERPFMQKDWPQKLAVYLRNKFSKKQLID